MSVFWDFSRTPEGKILDLRPLDWGYLPKVIDPAQPEEGWKPFKGRLDKVWDFKPIAEKKVKYLISKRVDDQCEE